jgi:hypothetical protein
MDDRTGLQHVLVAFSDKGAFQLNFGGVSPAWNDQTMALVNFKYGKITCLDADAVVDHLHSAPNKPGSDRRRRSNLTDDLREAGNIRWETNLGDGNRFEAVSTVVCPNAVLTVAKQQ